MMPGFNLDNTATIILQRFLSVPAALLWRALWQARPFIIMSETLCIERARESVAILLGLRAFRCRLRAVARSPNLRIWAYADGRSRHTINRHSPPCSTLQTLQLRDASHLFPVMAGLGDPADGKRANPVPIRSAHGHVLQHEHGVLHASKKLKRLPSRPVYSTPYCSSVRKDTIDVNKNRNATSTC